MDTEPQLWMVANARAGRSSSGGERNLSVMDDQGPRRRQRTKLSQRDKPRYELEWALPLEPGLVTHVTLFDLEPIPRRPWPGDKGRTKRRRCWTYGRP
jgi:hypothetical protein